MTADQLKTICQSIYGKGWQSKLAGELGRDSSTVRRWACGSVSVPPYVEAYLSKFSS